MRQHLTMRQHCVNYVKGFTHSLHNLFCVKANKINSFGEICGLGLQVYTIFNFLSQEIITTATTNTQK